MRAFKVSLFLAMLFAVPAQAGVFWGKSFQVNGQVPAYAKRAIASRLTQAELESFGLWGSVVALRNASIDQKIKWVHTATRQTIRAVNDSRDYWQTPSETLRRRMGDCEDFSVLRIELLRWLGVPSSQMLVFTGWTLKQGHAIAAVSTPSGTWALDNLRSSAYLSQGPRDFRPSIAMNRAGAWFYSISDR